MYTLSCQRKIIMDYGIQESHTGVVSGIRANIESGMSPMPNFTGITTSSVIQKPNRHMVDDYNGNRKGTRDE